MRAERRDQGPDRQFDLSAVSLPLVGGIPLYRGDLEADLKVVARHHLAEHVTGGLSWPSKMPCPAWGIPATRCRSGSVLAGQEGTTCSACYAMRVATRSTAFRRSWRSATGGFSTPCGCRR